MEYICNVCLDSTDDFDEPGWSIYELLPGVFSVTCPKCGSVSTIDVDDAVLDDDDEFYEQNSRDAYDSLRAQIDWDNDRAASDPYMGRGHGSF